MITAIADLASAHPLFKRAAGAVDRTHLPQMGQLPVGCAERLFHGTEAEEIPSAAGLLGIRIAIIKKAVSFYKLHT